MFLCDGNIYINTKKRYSFRVTMGNDVTQCQKVPQKSVRRIQFIKEQERYTLSTLPITNKKQENLITAITKPGFPKSFDVGIPSMQQVLCVVKLNDSCERAVAVVASHDRRFVLYILISNQEEESEVFDVKFFDVISHRIETYLLLLPQEIQQSVHFLLKEFMVRLSACDKQTVLHHMHNLFFRCLSENSPTNSRDVTTIAVYSVYWAARFNFTKLFPETNIRYMSFKSIGSVQHERTKNVAVDQHLVFVLERDENNNTCWSFWGIIEDPYTWTFQGGEDSVQAWLYSIVRMFVGKYVQCDHKGNLVSPWTHSLSDGENMLALISVTGNDKDEFNFVVRTPDSDLFLPCLVTERVVVPNTPLSSSQQEAKNKIIKNGFSKTSTPWPLSTWPRQDAITFGNGYSSVEVGILMNTLQ